MFVRTPALLLVAICGGAVSGADLHRVETPVDSRSASSERQSATVDPLFRTWTETHSKEYPTREEWAERSRIWFANHERIEAHNRQIPKPKYALGHNEYSDLSQDEFAKRFRLGAYSPRRPATADVPSRIARHLDEDRLPLELPDSVNWIALGGVAPVKNQGACGSCWAFSTTGALEGAKFVKSGELVALSEQQLLDCDKQDLGCNGGIMDNAFTYDETSGGLCSEDDYPYNAKQGNQCNPMSCQDVPDSEVTTFYDVPPGKEKSLLAAIAMQPVSVAIQADQFPFQFYKNGVLTDDSCGARAQLDHGVLAVGYGSDLETNEPYFLVKNSWGESWGENGYIRFSRNSENEYGMCGILKMASYPEVA